MRACLIGILITCSCSKDKAPTPPEKEIAERPTIVSRDGGVPTPAPKDAIKTGPSASGVLAIVNRDGGAFASLTGTSEFSSSGGVYVDSAKTHDPLDAKRLKSIMSKASDPLKPCLYFDPLVKVWPLEIEFDVDASGRASGLTLEKGQQVPCLTDWLEGLNLGAPKAGKPIQVKVVLKLYRE